MSEKIESFRDLNVYRLGFELQQEIFILIKKFPKEELHSLSDQIRRASRSIGANIAEAWQKRIYAAHFASKDRQVLLEKCRKVGRMLGKMMAKPENWCTQFKNQ